jgi:hypothetical protein
MGVPAHGGSLDGQGAVVVDGLVLVASGYPRNGGMPGNVLLAFAPTDGFFCVLRLRRNQIQRQQDALPMRSAMLTCLAAFSFIPAALAHHSFSAEFDANQAVTLTGTVTSVEWRSPHVWVLCRRQGRWRDRI